MTRLCGAWLVERAGGEAIAAIFDIIEASWDRRLCRVRSPADRRFASLRTGSMPVIRGKLPSDAAALKGDAWWVA